MLFFFCDIVAGAYAVYDRAVNDCGRAVCVRGAFVDVLCLRVVCVRGASSLCTLVLGEIPHTHTHTHRGFCSLPYTTACVGLRAFFFSTPCLSTFLSVA